MDWNLIRDQISKQRDFHRLGIQIVNKSRLLEDEYSNCITKTLNLSTGFPLIDVMITWIFGLVVEYRVSYFHGALGWVLSNFGRHRSFDGSACFWRNNDYQLLEDVLEVALNEAGKLNIAIKVKYIPWKVWIMRTTLDFILNLNHTLPDMFECFCHFLIDNFLCILFIFRCFCW